MRHLLTVLVLGGMAWAAPPVVTVPKEIAGDVGDFVAVKAEVQDGKAVKFVPLDSGLKLFPAGLLSDPTATVVTSAKPGRYRILCYSGNADGPSDPVTVTVVIGGAVKPDPVKPDPVKPDESSSPFAGDGLRVLIVYEKDDLPTLPQSQIAVLTGTELRDYLATRAKDWRAFDKDQTPADAVWADAMKRDRKSVPWILVGNGKAGHEGPLPATIADTIALIKKYEVK